MIQHIKTNLINLLNSISSSLLQKSNRQNAELALIMFETNHCEGALSCIKEARSVSLNTKLHLFYMFMFSAMYRNYVYNLRTNLLNIYRLYNLVCRDGFYGLGCPETCGHCTSGTFCNNVTGGCPNGCQENWSGSKCDGMTFKQITLKY